MGMLSPFPFPPPHILYLKKKNQAKTPPTALQLRNHRSNTQRRLPHRLAHLPHVRHLLPLHGRLRLPLHPRN
jgi:hypothetical protein